jgi:hypothetical protein
VRNWILDSKLSANQRYAYGIALIDGEVTIDRETEKAVLVKVVSEWGTFTFWCPKSQLLTEADLAAVEAKQEARLSRYDALVAAAKSAGVPGVRKGLKAATIRAKAAAAGITLAV